MPHRNSIAAYLVAASALAAPLAAAAGEFALLSRSLIQGPARSAVFAGNGLVLGTGGGVAVFGDSNRLAEPAYLAIEGEPYDLCVRGSIVYVAAFTGGLRTIDISNPVIPVETHHSEISQAMRCASAGGALCVSDERKSVLHVFTLENPREPRFRESLKLSHPISALCAERDILAVAYGGTIEIFRCSAAGWLERAASIDLEEGATDAVIHDAVLLALTPGGRVLAWDLAAPGPPRPIEGFRHRGIVDIASGDGAGALLGASRMIIPFDVGREGGTARLRAGRALSLPPRPYGSRYASSGGGGAAARKPGRIAVSSGRVASIAPLDGIDVCAIGRKGLRHADFFPTRGIALGILVEGETVYLANGYDGVRIGRLESGGSISWLSHLQTRDARGVALAGGSLLIADGDGGIKVAEAGDPRKARLVGAYASPHYLSALVVRGERVYCAAGFGGVEILDVSKPRRPRLVWRGKFSEVRGVDADARHLYVADGYEGLHIFSLDGGEPRRVSTLDTPGWTADVVVAGDRAYLADGGRGVKAADVSMRERPRIVSSAPTGSVARQVRLDGATLFAAAFTRGVFAFDVSDPTRIVEAARFQTVHDARAVCAAGRLLCVASGAGGVYVLDYSR